MKRPILGLGEILWDLLPDGPQLGGAPFNFTFHCHQLGWPAVMVSRIGQDSLGQEIQQRLRELNLSGGHLQIDESHPTGTVTVAFDTAGQPSYTIHENVAWDHLDWQPDLATLAQSAAAVCFGTLAQRSPTSRTTIRQVIAAARSAKIVCDINLRQHYWDREVIEDSLHLAHWLKLNSDELATLASLLNLGSTEESAAMRTLRERYALELVCLTRGADGCRVETATEAIEEPGIPVQVIDTIGAGDSFTAGLLVSVLEGQPLCEAVARANRLAARVAGSKGGTPRIDVEKLGDPGA